MGALPKRKISPYRRGKRRASIKKQTEKNILSYRSKNQHALKKAKKLANKADSR